MEDVLRATVGALKVPNEIGGVRAITSNAQTGVHAARLLEHARQSTLAGAPRALEAMSMLCYWACTAVGSTMSSPTGVMTDDPASSRLSHWRIRPV